MFNISDLELMDLVVKREAMPGVERLQTSYARYFRRNEAQVQQGWNIGMSRKNYEVAARAEQQHFLPGDHLLFSDLAPEAVTMKVVQAPTEFAVPVKQDRRLAPSFKVKVEVKHRGQLSLPMTLRSYIMTQHEKDNILSWHPEEHSDTDKKKITELKGTTSITHHFEVMSGPSDYQGLDGGNMMGMQPSGNMVGVPQTSGLFGQGETFQNAVDLLGAGGSRHGQLGGASSGPGSAANQQQSSISPAMLLQMWGGGDGMQRQQGNPVNSGMPATYEILGGSGQLGNLGFGQGAGGQVSAGNFSSMSMNNGGGGLNFGPKGAGGDMYGNNGGFLGLDLQQQQLQQQLQQQQQQHQLKQQLEMSNSFPGQQQQQQQQVGTLEHEFEFSNLELVRPTRMNKVYMVFAATMLDLDTVYVVYNVPTIGICRAEQREKACQKLGVPMPPAMATEGGNSGQLVKMEIESSTRKRESINAHLIMEGGGSGDEGAGSAHPQQPQQQQRLHTSDLLSSLQNLPAGKPSWGAAEETPVPYSRLALRDWILEEYERTGLTRRLTELDLQALLSQAGFPAAGGFERGSASATTTVSQGQWDEFVVQFRNVLKLLRQIANVWNLEEPCVISGFDMDRIGTIQALASEPPGTFICRFSMSQPGCLVLTCKTAANGGHGDSDNLLHAIIRIDDLYQRRVDTWIRDYAGATHVLDVYRQKRVDKRKVFASNYTSLRGMSGAESDTASPPLPPLDR